MAGGGRAGRPAGLLLSCAAPGRSEEVAGGGSAVLRLRAPTARRHPLQLRGAQRRRLPLHAPLAHRPRLHLCDRARAGRRCAGQAAGARWAGWAAAWGSATPCGPPTCAALLAPAGAGEMGRRWYEDGKYLKKKNTFTDFVACAEHLVAERFTSPQHLCIEGRSGGRARPPQAHRVHSLALSTRSKPGQTNSGPFCSLRAPAAGGLTMGAVINMRPDLFNAAILGVPFVDCLTTMVCAPAARAGLAQVPPPLPCRAHQGAPPAAAAGRDHSADGHRVGGVGCALAVAAVRAPARLLPCRAGPARPAWQLRALPPPPPAHRPGNPADKEFYDYMKSYSPGKAALGALNTCRDGGQDAAFRAPPGARPVSTRRARPPACSGQHSGGRLPQHPDHSGAARPARRLLGAW